MIINPLHPAVSFLVVFYIKGKEFVGNLGIDQADHGLGRPNLKRPRRERARARRKEKAVTGLKDFRRPEISAMTCNGLRAVGYHGDIIGFGNNHVVQGVTENRWCWPEFWSYHVMWIYRENADYNILQHIRSNEAMDLIKVQCSVAAKYWNDPNWRISAVSHLHKLDVCMYKLYVWLSKRLTCKHTHIYIYICIRAIEIE